MRIIDTIPHDECRISIFGMNNKYMVKFEVGSYEQTYKFNMDDYENLNELKQKFNDEFMEKTIAIFRLMHQNVNS